MTPASHRLASDDFTLVAYRGGAGEGPENALSSFVRSAALTGVALEMDVRSSSDGVPVIHHDARLDRTTSGHGRVGAHSAKALARLHLREAPHERIPPLTEVLSTVDSLVVLDVRTDHPVALDTIARSVQHYDPQRIVFASERHSVLRALRRRCPEVPMGGSRAAAWRRLLTGTGRADVWMLPERVGPLQVVTRSFVARASTRGERVWPFVIDTIEALQRARAHGVHGVFTNRPRALHTFLHG